MSRNDVILGLVALVLVGFSLVASIVIPRGYPDFPGARLRLFAAVVVALVAAMLGAVEVLGHAKHYPEPGEEAGAAEQPTETAEPGGGGGQAQGDPQAGREVYLAAEPACGGCHTLEEAGTSGTVGPNLDESLQGKDAAYVREAIVNPDAQVAEGFQPGVMPGDYGERLSDEQIADLAAFLLEAAR